MHKNLCVFKHKNVYLYVQENSRGMKFILQLNNTYAKLEFIEV